MTVGEPVTMVLRTAIKKKMLRMEFFVTTDYAAQHSRNPMYRRSYSHSSPSPIRRSRSAED